jgi:hypothetical protein
MRVLCVAIIGAVATLCAQNGPAPAAGPFGLQHATFVAKLLSPISTKTSNEGDGFTVLVEEPAAYQGAVLEGKISRLNKPKKGVGKGQAEVSFEFNTLTFQSKSGPVTVDLQDVANSQGVKSVDEEGHVIGKTSNRKRGLAALAGGALGAGIGAATGGASGAAKGGVIGAAAGLALALTMTTAASDLDFQPGAHFILDVSDRARRR